MKGGEFSYSVAVITPDSESGNPGSIPGMRIFAAGVTIQYNTIRNLEKIFLPAGIEPATL